MTDQEYIQAIRVNDQKIIGQIYSRFRSSTLGYLRKHTTLDEGDICDVYQEALIVVVNKVFQDGFELSSSLSTFIVSIARNIAMNRLRKNNHTVSLDADVSPLYGLAAESPNQQEEMEKQEQYNTLRHIISDMGEPCLSLLKAFYWDELSFEEIARKLPNYSTADSARNNKSRCVSKLRSYYEKLTS